MSILLNRKYGSRLECLYYVLLSTYKKYGVDNNFKLKDLKFDPNDLYNVHVYCQQLQNIVGRKCCPYLRNRLDNSKCYATQSIISDTTKSKAVSDVGGSLEALGFIKRLENNTYIISDSGESWVNSSFNSLDWEIIARKGVLSYGVIIGFLNKISDLPDTFNYQGIYLGYPHTRENVEYTTSSGTTKYINISTDSQPDSNTRTVSRLIAWCVTVGLLEPQGVIADTSPLAHIKYRDFLNSDELTVRNFKKTNLCKSLFDKKFNVENPLSYSRLHKNVGSLRENGGADLRNATLQYNSNILNRRYIFVYALNFYSKREEDLDFDKLIAAMKKHPNDFFAPTSDAAKIMSTECEIGDIAGIPFAIDNNKFKAKTTINEDVLNEDAPQTSINLAQTIIKEMEAM